MIEIISHPGPDRSVTLEGLRTFKVRSRRYRNRRIGEFLKELYLTEGRNTGFKKILESLKNNNSPLPEFEPDEAHDYFITRIFIRKGFKDYQNVDLNNTTRETTREKLIKNIKEKPETTVKELSAITGLTEDGVQYHINKMRKEGILFREGSTKAGRWIVR